MSQRAHSPVVVPVVDAVGAAAADRAAIAAGVPSRALMQRAGAAAATEIARHFRGQLPDGVVVATGSGNNGGDGWVVAAALHAVGLRVRVVECAGPRTDDARAERALAVAAGVPVDDDIATLGLGAPTAIDALLGTGYRADTPPRGRIAEGIAALRAHAARGGTVVALDVPSGLDATTGAHHGAPPCALTISFGTVKRGQLIARGLCGAIAVLDIGLGAPASGGAMLATPLWFRANLPRIAADAHKGTRKKVAIVGGAEGMAGAAMLAARAALRSGAGMVKCVVSPASLPAIQRGEPAALAAAWPDDDDAMDATITRWADALLLGPGLGVAESRAMVERVLRAFRGPVVLDADALNAFAGDAAALAPLLAGRQALLTPHPAEFGRLAELSVEEVLARRFTAPASLAALTGAAVLLKGVPTSVTSPDGHSVVVAEGTPLLATGGSGDILGGVAVTLLAQAGDAALAGALAAYAHGRAAAMVSPTRVRGYTLDDLLATLPDAWALGPPRPRPPLLALLPAVGEGPA